MSLVFERAGSGPPLVLIHGLGHRRQAWDVLLPLLTPHREVITLDLPGHGESAPLRSDGENAVAVMADEIAALLDALGLDRPHLAGSSLGGWLALTLAARGLAASVTALSPAGFPNHAYQVRYLRTFFAAALVGAKLTRPAVPALAASPLGKTALYALIVAKPRRLSAAQVIGDMAALAKSGQAVHAVFATFEPFTAGIADDIPVTIAWGAKDRLLSPANARVARSLLPSARLLKLSGCGHVPMTDDPGKVAQVLLTGSGG